MAKKILSIVLSVTMLLGIFAVAALAGPYFYTPESAAAEIAEKLWYVDYDEDVDWKDEIDRRWLTGTPGYDESATEAAPQDVLEYNLFFWDDEIIEAYNSAASNEDYWNLYNKMATPLVVDFPFEENGESFVESEILYDFAYEYRAEEKATFELDIQASAETALPGDIVTVEVYATSNFLTSQVVGGIFYNKQYLTPLTVEFCTESDPTWVEKSVNLDIGAEYDAEGNLTFDRRNEVWPADMCTEENLAKYGVSYMYARADEKLGTGNFNHGRQFDNELLFTATYQIKEDAPENAVIDFFVCDSVLDIANLCIEEWGADYGYSEPAYCWQLTRVDSAGLTDDTMDLKVDYVATLYNKTVTSNVEILTVASAEPPVVLGEIVSVTADEAYIGETTDVKVEVTGSPEALLISSANGDATFTREDATIETTEAGEIWTCPILVTDTELACEVYANYGEAGVAGPAAITLTGTEKQDLDVHSIEIPDMYPDAKNGGVIVAGKHDVIIKTSTDVVKVQFYDESNGTSYTYTSWSGPGKMPYEDIDGERVWTITHAFGPYGTRSLLIRTRSETTFFAATESGATLDATVVY